MTWVASPPFHRDGLTRGWDGHTRQSTRAMAGADAIALTSIALHGRLSAQANTRRLDF